jgi:hypothetical protein
MRHFADMCTHHGHLEDEVFVGFMRCSDASTCERELICSGKGAEHPSTKSMLLQFSDILVSNLPPRDPSERLIMSIDRKRSAHTIDTVKQAKPLLPRHAGFSRLWILNYSSTTRVVGKRLESAFSVTACCTCCVRTETPDTVTGQRAIRFGISYVKLK